MAKNKNNGESVISPIDAISPLDGRYRSKLEVLRPIVSEFGLIYHRLKVEIEWLITLSENSQFISCSALSANDQQYLRNILEQFTMEEAEMIKEIERTTNHDVKAIEYYIQEKIKNHPKLSKLIPFIHFGCTSEDINNLAYGLMLADLRSQAISPLMQTIIEKIYSMAQENSAIPMLSRTHGQPASPTTLGKELANFATRLKRQFITWQNLTILGKFNGAVGNFNAHFISAPEIDWMSVSETFIRKLGLTPNLYTTQIEPHDFLAEFLHCLMRVNTILIDLARDTWGYISLGYFNQKKLDHETGSSTMPHKINPIDFENSEGNLGIANALASHLADKLPISRWQRDLSDSTVLRNIGTISGYTLLAYQSLMSGLNKLTVNHQQIAKELDQHWEILAEAIQTVLRRYGVADAYEQLKALTRGNLIDQKAIYNFIEQLPVPIEARQRLQALTPSQYIGYASRLTEKAIKEDDHAEV